MQPSEKSREGFLADIRVNKSANSAMNTMSGQTYYRNKHCGFSSKVEFKCEIVLLLVCVRTFRRHLEKVTEFVMLAPSYIILELALLVPTYVTWGFANHTN